MGARAMTDIELLELAAKAAGMTIDTHYVDGGASVWEGERHHSDWIPDWDPLTDDGDALRLAVTLKISIHLRPKRVEVLSWPLPKTPYGFGGTPFPKVETVEPYDDDRHAATRRAIVKAAAEIGENMK